MNENIYFHGVARGKRPDGFGIIFNISGSFTAKGKFANSKISGIGRAVT